MLAFAAFCDDAVNPDIRLYVLTEGIDPCVHQLNRIQRVDAVPRSAGRVRSDAFVLKDPRIHRQCNRTGGGRMGEMRLKSDVHIVEGTAPCHFHFCAVGFFRRRSNQGDSEPELIRQPREDHRGAGRRRCDPVVTAGVAVLLVFP